MYPTWIWPFCDNGHFTLFVVHIINQTDSFEKSCVLYFDSLPLFHSDIKRHLDIIKRICYCIGTQFDEKLFQIPVPQQKTNDCGCCVCYFATKYAENVPRTVDQTKDLFNGIDDKFEMDNERQRMINSIEEDKYFSFDF